MLFRSDQQRTLQTDNRLGNLVDRAAHPQPEIGRDLIVARPRGVEPSGNGPDQLGKPVLDVHVDIFERPVLHNAPALVLVRDLRQALFASSSGELTGVEGVVLIRGEPPGGRDGAERELEDRFVGALLRGLESFGTPVAGVERTDTRPTNVEWYRSQDVSSIDNVDQVAGRTSLVLVLAGGGAGAYGVKSSAESLLPEALVPRP